MIPAAIFQTPFSMIRSFAAILRSPNGPCLRESSLSLIPVLSFCFFLTQISKRFRIPHDRFFHHAWIDKWFYRFRRTRIPITATSPAFPSCSTACATPGIVAGRNPQPVPSNPNILSWVPAPVSEPARCFPPCVYRISTISISGYFSSCCFLSRKSMNSDLLLWILLIQCRFFLSLLSVLPVCPSAFFLNLRQRLARHKNSLVLSGASESEVYTWIPASCAFSMYGFVDELSRTDREIASTPCLIRLSIIFTCSAAFACVAPGI